MTEILDLQTGDDAMPLILLRQCEHLRHMLLTRIYENFQRLDKEVDPLLTNGARMLNQAAQTSWSPESSGLAIDEVYKLTELYAKAEQLFRCYHAILADHKHQEEKT